MAIWSRRLQRKGLSPEDRNFIRLHLGSGGQFLFFQMDPADQRHALNVAKTILARHGQGSDPPVEEMIQAALLHDAGKVAGELTVLGRVLVGFIRRIAPALRLRWADRAGNAIRRACYVDLVHARRGAYMARAFGVAEEVAAAIRGHHDPPRSGEPKLLTCLREADGEN